MTSRAYRIYDKTTKQMLYPKELGKMGVFLTASGDPVQYKSFGKFAALQNVVVMFATGLNTHTGQQIWDGDVVDVQVPTEWGSFIWARGMMRWDAIGGKWSVHIPNPSSVVPQGDFPVMGMQVVGDIYQHPNLMSHGGKETPTA